MIFFIGIICILLLLITISYLTLKSNYESRCQIYTDEKDKIIYTNLLPDIFIQTSNGQIENSERNIRFAQWYIGTNEDILIPRISSLVNNITIRTFGIYNVNQFNLNIPGESVKTVHKPTGSNVILNPNPLFPYLSICNVNFLTKTITDETTYKGIIPTDKMLFISFDESYVDLYRIILKLLNNQPCRLVFCFFIYGTNSKYNYDTFTQMFMNNISNGFIYIDF